MESINISRGERVIFDKVFKSLEIDLKKKRKYLFGILEKGFLLEKQKVEENEEFKIIFQNQQEEYSLFKENFKDTLSKSSNKKSNEQNLKIIPDDINQSVYKSYQKEIFC